MTYRQVVSGVGIAESDEDRLLLMEEVLAEAWKRANITTITLLQALIEPPPPPS